MKEVIRGHIGFDGLLLSDDLSMQALGGTLGERAERALAAGCDIALHCNGRMDEMTEIAARTGPMTEAAGGGSTPAAPSWPAIATRPARRASPTRPAARRHCCRNGDKAGPNPVAVHGHRWH